MTELTGPRLSGLMMGCARRTYYEAIGAEAEPHDARTLRIFRRGHAVEAAIVKELADELKADGRRLQRQVNIPWPRSEPVGTGHADVFIPREKLIVEITSTAGGALAKRKAMQSAAYAYQHGRAQAAAVLSIDPSTFEEHLYPINVDALVPEIDRLMGLFTDGLKAHEPPPRACVTPLDPLARMCPFARTVCFPDWQSPPPDELLATPALRHAARMMKDRQDDIRLNEKDTAELAEKRDANRELLEPYMPRDEYVQVGDVDVKVIEVQGRQSFDFAAAAAAGVDLSAVEAFINRGDPHLRWYTREHRED